VSIPRVVATGKLAPNDVTALMAAVATQARVVTALPDALELAAPTAVAAHSMVIS